MSLRLAKQIIYGFFYLALWSVIVAGVYFLFFKPAPSCFDNTQNQGEAGIDCGGPCSAVCIPKDIRPIELIGHVLTFPIDSTHKSLLVQVKNPNSSYAAKNFKYTFLFYDAGGKVLKSLDDDSFIYASEVKYLLVPNTPLDVAGSVSRIDFGVGETKWDSINNFKGPPLITIQNTITSISENGLTITGVIVNNDTVIFPATKVIAIFGGRFGEIAGGSETQLDNVTPNESRPFSIIYPPMQNINASNTKLFIYSARP